MDSAETTRQPTRLTPARRQYLSLKRDYPDVILFFRMGDFYEAFDDDAVLIAEVLDIALTSREMGSGNRIPMAGVPHHAAEGYIGRLIAAGHKVALAEQISEPSDKGIVDRAVTSIITPGTVTRPELLGDQANCYIVALVSDGSQAGLAYADATTGEFATTQISARTASELEDGVQREILRLRAVELLAPADEPLSRSVGEAVVRSTFEPLAWRLDDARQRLLEHFQVVSLEPFGCDRLPLAARAAGALLAYLQHTQMNSLRQITTLHTYSLDAFMSLDAHTRRNLELIESNARGGGPSLFSTLDATLTAPGSRQLRRWINQPLLDQALLEARYDGIGWLREEVMVRARLRDALKGLGDVERIINRVANQQAGPREVARLGDALARLPTINSVLKDRTPPAMIEPLPECPHLSQRISAALVDEPPVALGGGQPAIRPGFSPELDRLRDTLRRDRDYIASLEQTERETTGIRGLKVGYNKVFGYYLEISNSQRTGVPDHYIRKQTLVNAERYITPDLKEAEQRVLQAEERIAEAEADAFAELIRAITLEADAIREIARRIATLDTLAALADIAATRGYVRPEIVNENVLEIEAGRHPIVEHGMGQGQFVANSTALGPGHGEISIITGPNMAGKSTYLRQVALLVLMAQAGAFVPAKRMRFGIIDRIFTRIGAQDDLASRQSTFMVEMLETASILNHATARSLLVLDEIGRGTSTYDGLAIATAIVEYIHNTPRLGCKTLFATHYHELTALAEVLPRVKNYRVEVRESGERITFLYRVVEGSADRSYGVYVAQLAGMPHGVVRRAEEILSDLEHENGGATARARQREALVNTTASPMQLTLFGALHPAVKRLQEIEVDALTPLDALRLLYELTKLASSSDGN
jgi:DNA mismatch repair protein MutS